MGYIALITGFDHMLAGGRRVLYRSLVEEGVNCHVASCLQSLEKWFSRDFSASALAHKILLTPLLKGNKIH